MNSRIGRVGWMAAALFALAGCEREAVVDTGAIEDEIRRGGREMATAYNSGDIETVVAKFAPDAMFMPPQSEATSGSDASGDGSISWAEFEAVFKGGPSTG